MPPHTEHPFAQRASRKKNLLVLAGVLAIILIANGVASLFGLTYSHENHLADLQTLGLAAQGLETARAAQVHFKKQVQE